MADPTRILAFAGSARRESLNRRFLAAAVKVLQGLGCEVTVVDPHELALPLYHGDLEDASGMPPGAVTLVGQIAAHQGLLIASPEYNAMITPLLKNTIDWCSRSDSNPFEGKAVAVISASPGPLGGVRSLQMAQMLLLKLGCHVVPGQCTLPQAHQAFDGEGGLVVERSRQSLATLAKALAQAAGRAGS